ncbi:MAG: hypothetical protein K2Y23_23920 [Cyanobacteria bacterium]|nr:hypothetical protein [Cyanobacteriota bacterium]
MGALIHQLADAFDGMVQNHADFNRDLLKVNGAATEANHVEQIVDQPRQPSDLTIDGASNGPDALEIRLRLPQQVSGDAQRLQRMRSSCESVARNRFFRSSASSRASARPRSTSWSRYNIQTDELASLTHAECAAVRTRPGLFRVIIRDMTTGGGSVSSAVAFLSGGGELGQRIREYDWSRTPLGDPEACR